MLREQLIKKEVGGGAFRWRSHEISRIEGLSDAVFGFAITLLVVSLEVPKTFNELLHAMRGFGAFCNLLHTSFHRLVQPIQVLQALWSARHAYRCA